MQQIMKINPTKYLDSKLVRIYNLLETQVYSKDNKFPVHCP